MKKTVTFGEIMLRLKTPEHLRIVQTDGFEASYGGAEANVAVSLAVLKDPVSFVTKLPDNPVGTAALNEVRRYGVDTSKVVVGGSRLGIYFFEKGTDIRPTNVVYDREGSALALSKAEEFHWDEILKDTDIFYFSGVTPTVCDLNYRSKMWGITKAQSVMGELMNYVTLCIANDEDFESSLGIHAYDGDISKGIDQIDSYKAGMKEIQSRYPGCKAVASVLRNMYTAEDGDWLGIYLKDGVFYESPVHKVHSFEAVGAGDAFAGALLHSLVREFEPQELIDFSISASVLKLMIQRDFNLVTENEIQRVMESKAANLQR